MTNLHRVIILADRSAGYQLGGLPQLVRLIRTLEECFAPAIETGKGPDVIVFWQSSTLYEARIGLDGTRPGKLRITHRFAGGDPIERGGDALVLPSSLVIRRGTLRRLLDSPSCAVPFAVVSASKLAAAGTGWEAMADLLPKKPLRDADRSASEPVWLVHSPEEIPAVERCLFNTLGKSSDGLVSRALNRPISTRLSRLLIQTSITPNQISFMVLGVLAASTWILTRGTAIGFVVGMLLFHLASVLDGCDGEIARAKFLETRLGALLDTSVDLLGNHLLALAVAVGLSRQPGIVPQVGAGYLLEGLLTALGISIGIWGVARYTRPTSGANHFNEFGSSLVESSGAPRLLQTFLYGAMQMLRRDTYAFIFVLFAVLRRPEWILHSLAIGVAAHFPVIVWSWWKTPKVSGSVNP